VLGFEPTNYGSEASVPPTTPQHQSVSKTQYLSNTIWPLKCIFLLYSYLGELYNYIENNSLIISERAPVIPYSKMAAVSAFISRIRDVRHNVNVSIVRHKAVHRPIFAWGPYRHIGLYIGKCCPLPPRRKTLRTNCLSFP